MLIFSILACVCAAFFAAALEFDLRSGEGSKTPLSVLLDTLGLLIPVIACGAVQYWKMTQSGATGSRLWLAVAGTAVGAPIAGVILMLIVVFALFSKSP
jgi:hypothetical protein